MLNINSFRNAYLCSAGVFSKYLGSAVQLFLRLTVARVFLNSGLTKWNGWFEFNAQKYDLFMYEFFCPEPPRPSALQLCNAETLEYSDGSLVVALIKVLAVTTGVLEIIFPALLIMGLLSRYAASGLLLMSLFIQLAVFPTLEHWWNPAVWWALALLAIIAHGPGAWSLDNVLKLERCSGTER